MSTDSPIFSFALGVPGTAQAKFSCGGSEIEFQLDNVCNPLGDLLHGMVSLITTPSQLWGEENSCHVVWYSGTDSYNWFLSVDSNQDVSLRITKSLGFFEDDEVEMLLYVCPYVELVQCVVGELDSFVKKVGLLNYAQQWQKDEFPITYFLFLKKHLIDNNRWDQEVGKQCDILSDELLLLLA